MVDCVNLSSAISHPRVWKSHVRVALCLIYVQIGNQEGICSSFFRGAPVFAFTLNVISYLPKLFSLSWQTHGSVFGLVWDTAGSPRPQTESPCLQCADNPLHSSTSNSGWPLYTTLINSYTFVLSDVMSFSSKHCLIQSI